MGGPEKGSGESRYWRIKVWIEVLKTGIWIGFQWVRSGGPFGSF